jgi:hypothetical protein
MRKLSIGSTAILSLCLALAARPRQALCCASCRYAILLPLVFLLPSFAFADDGVEFFEKNIRPVLVRHCYQCHSAKAAASKKLKGGLQLDTRARIRAGGDTGPAVVPGKVADSLLIRALRHEELEMPPTGKLPNEIIADFVKWIELGAPDPRDGVAPVKSASVDIERGRQFWAFVPPKVHPRPKVRQQGWPLKELDWFVLAAQERQGLTPNSHTQKRTWIRRVTFDLIGLPPTPQEIEAFDRDDSPQAYTRVVDRLLGSPHYGERWARHWLDVARYTDDYGSPLGQKLAPHAYRYRNWVIEAFNKDLPYDQFIRLQLAGDLIADPATDYVQRLGGLGFQGLGQRFSGNVVGMAKKKIADELDDRVDTVSRSMLALTVSCARCHDHKFDPIPTQDYYSLAAAYNNSNLTVIPLASPEAIQQDRAWKQDRGRREGKLRDWLNEHGRGIGRGALNRAADYLTAAWTVKVYRKHRIGRKIEEVAAAAKLHPFFLKRWVEYCDRGNVDKAPPALKPWFEIADRLVEQSDRPSDDSPIIPPLLKERAAQAQAAIVAAARKRGLREQRYQDALSAAEPSERRKVAREPLASEIETLLKVVWLDGRAPLYAGEREVREHLVDALPRNEVSEYESRKKALADFVASAPPKLLEGHALTGGGKTMRANIRGNPENLGDVAPPGFPQVLRSADSASGNSFTRLDLAEAIASSDNPLTARVWVNRIWHYHFGRGIVGTPSNFGQLGDRPSHPELLDTLAVRFMESGWSTKWLHREIVLSSTYRLSSESHVANIEKDADNRYLWRMSPRRLDFEAWRDAMLAVSGTLDDRIGGPSLHNPKDTKSELHPEDPTNRRRTVYSFISRYKPNPTLALFDFPEPNVSSEQRTLTTIPQQQLFALNGRFVEEMAKAFAKRLTRDADDEARLQFAWKLAFGRPPTEQEMRLSLAYIGSGSNAWERLCHALLMTNEFAFVN